MKFKDILKAQLLAACEEVTSNARYMEKNRVETKPKYSKEEIEQIDNLMQGLGLGGAARNNWFVIFATLLKAPELAKDSVLEGSYYEPFTVFVPEGGSWITEFRNKPWIITNGKNRFYLHHTGSTTGHSNADKENKVRLATPQEVVDCINNLNDSQWKTIMSDDLFRPVVNAALEQEVSIDENSISSSPEDE